MTLARTALVAAALAAAACTQPSSRWAPAQPVPTPAFPATWDQVQVIGGAAPQPAARQAEPALSSAASAPPPRLVSASPVARTAAPLIAVLEFTNRLKGEDKNLLDTNYLSNAVRAAVKRTLPDARLMTQENIQVLLQSAHKTLEDCQGECEVDTGRLLGADIIITGDLLRVGTKLKLDMRMHDTKSGQLISGSTASGRSVDDLDTDLPRAVKELMLGLR